MRIVSFVFMLLLATFSYASPLAAKPITYPDVQVVEAANGQTAWVIEDHSLPIVTLKITFKESGSAYDPDGKSGLATLVAEMLDEGAGPYDNQLFKKRLESLAMDLSAGAGKDNLSISVRTLKDQLGHALDMVKLAMLEPHFSEDALKRTREEILLSLAKDKEDQDSIATLAWEDKMFGKHPYGHDSRGTAESLAEITTQDLRHYTLEHFQKGQMLISIVGDITTEEVRNILDDTLVLPINSTLIHTNNVPSIEKFPENIEEHILFPTDQTVIVFGQKGIPYSDPDFYAAYILNYVLGGGSFQSRLMSEIRENRGLVYSVSTSLDFMQKASIFRGYLATKKESAGEALTLTKQITTYVKKAGITQEEMEAAKQYLMGSFPLRLATSNGLVQTLDFMQRFDLGTNFLNQRNQKIDAVSRTDINRVAQSLLDPDNFVTVIVGR
ncbi:MAG: insulinase family protein [Hyphomicrobiales bacterium]|nr:insulinase family protein [Hyphomicrobiales bacterium]